MGHISIQNRTMMLANWHSKLKLRKEDHDTLPIWIRLKDIPLALWSQAGIGRIASAIGGPLYVDARTEGMKRLSFARVCVEIKATQPRVDSVKIRWDDELIPIPIEYEWKPLSRASCGIYGHKCRMTGFACAATSDAPVNKHPDAQTQIREEWQRVQRRTQRRLHSPQGLTTTPQVPQLAGIYTQPLWGSPRARIEPEFNTDQPQNDTTEDLPIEKSQTSSLHSSQAENGENGDGNVSDATTNLGNDLSSPSPPNTRSRAMVFALPIPISTEAAESPALEDGDSPSSSKTTKQKSKRKKSRKKW
ncbi:uncharacterized protein LOC125315370 [Rhodamnia argentea]|uniref:Uncharacterized protein LOC125315370 n=1 Tax=Rhodamnia argentea TaxID=178133 RepID=A0ABM3HH53_9MYRT|nr:uncharacterized protein LOC125315370 [Rhodamnia argentea]